MEENKKLQVDNYAVKFIAFLDDDEKTKEKYASLEEDDFWLYIELYDIVKKQYYGEKFRIPKTRVLKIKDYSKGESDK